MTKESRHGTRTKSSRSEKKSSIGVMDIILIIVGASLLLFTIAMIRLFREYGAVPDTLVTCVFATLGGECGIMGWIKTTKDRNREHKWEQEDREAAIKEAEQPEQEESPGNGAV